MKKTLILATLCISSLTLAQPSGKGQEKKTEKKEQKTTQVGKSDQKEKPQPENRPQQQQQQAKEKEKTKEKGNGNGNGNKPTPPGQAKKGNEEGKSNQGNAYGKNKGELSGREFGQQRAAEARAKHQAQKPTTNEEAVKRIESTALRNDVLLNETERKIQLAKQRMEELRKAGTLPAQEFEEKVKALEELSKKRATIEMRLQ